MSPSSIVCLGLSHQTAPIELRERLSCSLVDFSSLPIPRRRGKPDVAPFGEMVVINTCNRLELYVRFDDSDVDRRAILAEQLATARDAKLDEISDHLYFLVGQEAVEHLFLVAAGLESQVLGEPQILGQVTDAYMAAVEADTAGPVLTALFRAAIRVGKRARTETAISNNPASIGSIAINKAQQIVGDLRLRRPLVVGMGEMGQLAMRSLQSRGVRQIAVANRTRDKAETFGNGCIGDFYTLAELVDSLAEADVVISATAAPHVIIGRDMVLAAMSKRAGKELVLVDIAVPRDVDPVVGDIPGVHLFDMDDLQSDLDDALAARQQEIPRVKAIIQEEVTSFETELRQVSIRPLIAGLRQKAELIRQRELERTLRFMGDVDPRTLRQMQLFSRSLVNKLLHEPTVRLKEKAGNGESVEYAEALQHLFSLEPPVGIEQDE